MNEKVAQHFVPQTYLRKFYNPKGHLWVLDLEKLSVGYSDFLETKTSGQICHDKYYYDLDQDFISKNPEYSALDKQHIENETFKRLENQYGKTLFNAVTSKSDLTNIQCESFADFIVQMKVRNPYYRNFDLKNNATRLIDNVKKQLKFNAFNNDRFKSIPDNLKEQLIEITMDKKYSGANLERNLQLATIVKREQVHKESTFLKDVIRRHPWCIAECDLPGMSFITTDNPGASISRLVPGTFNTKFNDDFTFYLPLSPKHCMIIDGTQIDVNYFYDPSSKKISLKKLNFEETMGINNITIQKSNKLIISKDQHILTEIAKRNVGRKLSRPTS